MFKKRTTRNNEHDWTPTKYQYVLHHNKTKKQLEHFFPNMLQKCYRLPILEKYPCGHVWPLPSKTIMPPCRNFDVYLHAKNELHS